MHESPERISEGLNIADESMPVVRSALTRRKTVLLLASALCAPTPLLTPRAEAAAAAAGVAVIFQVFGQLVALTQKSKSLDSELSAQKLELEQILKNQLFIIQTLQEVSDKIDDVRKQLNELPSEVVSLREAINAETIATKLINRLKSFEARPRDAEARTLFWSGIKEVEALGYLLRAAVHQSTRQAGLAIAAKYLLHSVQIFLRSQQRFPIKDPNRLDALTNTSSNLVDILSEMTSENGLTRLINEQAQKTALAAENLAKLRFAKLLPGDFSAVSSAAPGSRTQRESVLCFMTPEKSTPTGQSSSRALDSARSITFYSTESREIRKVRFVAERMVAFGGRPGYEIVRDDPKLWVSDRWSRDVYKIDSGARGVRSSQPEAKLQGCLETPDIVGASQAEFNVFLNALAIFNTNVALESRLAAIHNSAQADLATAKSVEQAFDKLKGRVKQAGKQR